MYMWGKVKSLFMMLKHKMKETSEIVNLCRLITKMIVDGRLVIVA